MRGGVLVGFASMISTVLSGSSADSNGKTSVKSSRLSSPGNLRLSTLTTAPLRAARRAPEFPGPFPGPRYGRPLAASTVRPASIVPAASTGPAIPDQGIGQGTYGCDRVPASAIVRSGERIVEPG